MIGYKPPRWQWTPGRLAPPFQAMTRGMTELWPMWDGGGTSVRSLVGTNHGTLVQSAGFPAYGSTLRGVGLQNQSGSGYVNVVNPAVVAVNAVTVLGVVHVGFSGITTAHVVSKHPDYFLSGDNTSNKLRFAVNTSGGTFSTAGWPMSFSTVHGFVGRYDRKTIDLYADGALVASLAETRALTNTGTLRLMGYAGGGLQWFGEMVMGAVWPEVALAPDACALLSRDPFGLIRPRRRLVASRVATLGGTALAGINEADIVAGGKTITITLTGTTWVP